MAKKKPWINTTWVKTTAISIIVIPLLAFSWKNIISIWAAPEKIDGIVVKVNKHETTEEKIERLLLEQQARIDKQETVSALQIENLKELINVTKEIKKK